MKEAKEDVTDRLDWIAFKNQFFSSVLIADQDFDKASLTSTPQQEGSGYMKNYTADMTTFFDPTGKQPTEVELHIGRLLSGRIKESCHVRGIVLHISASFLLGGRG